MLYSLGVSVRNTFLMENMLNYLTHRRRKRGGGSFLPLEPPGKPHAHDQSVGYKYVAVIHTDGFDYIRYALPSFGFQAGGEDSG